jgi:hypothetical protein
MSPINGKLLPILLLVNALVASEAKPGEIALTNPAKDIQVLSDRKESISQFFQRNRIVVGSQIISEVKTAIEAKKVREMVFVNYSSHNDDAAREQLFGTNLKLAPMPPSVAQLLRKQLADPDGKERLGLTLILRRDAKDGDLYHVAGCTTRTSVSFFANDKRTPPDEFSPRDLRFKGEAKKD